MATLAIGISKGPSGYTCKVPINSLSESGVPPEEGDTVQYSVEGTVQSVSGSDATVKIDSINGEPVSEEASESPQEEATEEQGEGPASGGPSGAGGPGLEDLRAMGARLRKAARGKPMPPAF